MAKIIVSRVLAIKATSFLSTHLVCNGATLNVCNGIYDRMARHILTGVSLALLVLVGVTLAEEISNNQVAAPHSPFKSDFAYRFFETGSQYSKELGNVTIAPHKNYNDAKCDSDVDRIYAGLRKYEEWAIECKH